MRMSTSASSAKRFPLDFASLEKGSWIEGKDLDEAITVKRNHPHWALKLSQLVERVHDEREDLCARVDHDRIRIMTDEEASEYGERRLVHHVRGIKRVRLRLARVDVNQLTSEQKRVHETRMLAAGNIATATRMALKKEARILALLKSGAQSDED